MKKALTGLLALLAICPLLANASSSSSLDFYRVIPLVTGSPSGNTDLLLINPWGLVFTAEDNVVVANNGTSTSTIYTPTGGGLNFNPGTPAPVRPTLFVNVPSNPTGLVANLSKQKFYVGSGSKKKPAEYLYATEEGTILAYNQHVDPLNAIVVVDNSASGSVYKGLEIAKVNDKFFLYAADFHHAKIDVFNSHFEFVKSFTDSTIPSGYAPFNIRQLNDKLFVTYAKQLPPNNIDDDPGLGNGFVDVFTLKGKFIKRLVSGGQLNSPWGLAISPHNFGDFSNALLVGNAGDGFINAYNPHTGAFLGQLYDSTSTPIQISRLWTISFDHNNPERPELYYTAGTTAETDGTLGVIQFAGNDG